MAEGNFKNLVVVDTIKKKELVLYRLHSLQPVLVVSLWALLSAWSHGRLSANNIFRPMTSLQQCLESKTCYVLPSEFDDEAYAILYGLLCCSVLQAAAAVLALLLTGRHRCWSVAYAALAATTAGDFLYLRIRWLVLTALPGDDRVIPQLLVAIMSLVLDLLCFLDLILRGRGVVDQMRKVRKAFDQ